MKSDSDQDNFPHILIVDDEKSNTFLLSKILGKLDCQIVTASDGWEALEKVNEYDFALIVLDIFMPRLNGYETLVRIKTSAKNKETPVFLMTEMETDQELLVKAYNAGAVDFINKPVNLRILQRKAKYFLEFFRQKEDLKIARRKTEELMRSRISLMADITHELRSPLFAMLGMIEQLKENCHTDEQKHLLNRIEINSENLVDTVNDFLDFSKAETKKLEVENEYFSLKKLVTDLIDVMHFQYHKSKDVKLELSIENDVPEFVRADRKKIRHILMNLLSNAIKFTQNGSVKLELRMIGEKLGKSMIKFSVVDTGVGIPENKIGSIFNEYAQVESHIQGEGSRNTSGLGLSIVNKMIDVLGGKIKVKSSLGEGSIFSFTLPVESGGESDLQEVSDPHSFDGLLGENIINILIVDDEPDNLFVLKNYLNVEKINLSMAHDYDQAIELMENKFFDIIFLDISMPVKNGFEMANEYRGICKERGVKEAQIVLLSAYVYDDEMQKKLSDASIDHYLTKPVKKGALFEKIVSLVHGVKDEEKVKVSSLQIEKEEKEFDFSYLSEDFIEYLPRFLMLKSEEIHGIFDGVQNKNLDVVFTLCHKVLGTAKSFGLNKIAEQVESVQILSKKDFDQNYDEIFKLAKKSVEQVDYLKDNLEEILKK